MYFDILDHLADLQPGGLIYMACLLDQANIFETSRRIIFEKNTQTANLLAPNLARYCTLPPLTLESFGSRINSKPGGCVDDVPL